MVASYLLEPAIRHDAVVRVDVLDGDRRRVDAESYVVVVGDVDDEADAVLPQSASQPLPIAEPMKG